MADSGLSMSQAGGWPAAAETHSGKRVSGHLSDSVSNLPAAQSSVTMAVLTGLAGVGRGQERGVVFPPALYWG